MVGSHWVGLIFVYKKGKDIEDVGQPVIQGKSIVENSNGKVDR